LLELETRVKLKQNLSSVFYQRKLQYFCCCCWNKEISGAKEHRGGGYRESGNHRHNFKQAGSNL